MFFLSLLLIDCTYYQTYKIVCRHKVLRTLDQNHIRKVADVLNVSQIKLTDLNLSIFYMFLTSQFIFDILVFISGSY
jgi:hypothetical protein